MSEDDRRHWDDRYRNDEVVPSVEPPEFLVGLEDLVPTSGAALDVACGRGLGALWMASRGMTAVGVDVSPVAVDLARRGAARFGLAERCRFEVHDLDGGLPETPDYPDRFTMILCHLFRQPSLYDEIARRLAPGGLLAAVMLAAHDGDNRPYRASPGELTEAFAAFTVHSAGSADGRVWLVASKPGRS